MGLGGDDGGDDGDDGGSDTVGGDSGGGDTGGGHDDGSDAGGGDGEVDDGVDGESLQWCGRALKTGGLRWCTALSTVHCALCRPGRKGHEAAGRSLLSGRKIIKQVCQNSPLQISKGKSFSIFGFFQTC